MCSITGCSRPAGRIRRKVARSRRCSPISCWMNWIANLNVLATGSCATRTTATSTSAATGQCTEECRRPAVAAFVPWLHRHGQTTTTTTHRRQGRGPVQGSGTRADAASSRGQPGADDCWHRWTAGYDDACVASSGSSGRRVAIAIENFVVSRSRTRWPVRLSSVQRDPGG